MGSELRLLPADLRGTASNVGRLGGETDEVQQRLRGEWSRLDAGWETFAEEDVDTCFGDILREIGLMSAMLGQMGGALIKTADGIEAADQAAVVFFDLEAAEESGGRPPGLARPARQNPPPPASPMSDLEKMIREMIGNTCPADPTPLLEAIHNATLEERQAVLNNPELLAMFHDGLGGYAPAYVAALLEGALYWPRGSWPDSRNRYRIYIGSDRIPQDDSYIRDNYSAFADWIRGGDENANRPGTRTSTMNCWEYVFFSAYLSGQIDYEHLTTLHNQAAKAGRDAAHLARKLGEDTAVQAVAGYAAYYEAIRGELGVDQAKPWQQGDVAPPAGSLIFFDGPEHFADGLDHVAISLGTVDSKGQAEIMSLWILPGDANGYVYSAQRTTIEAVQAAAKQEHMDLQVTYGENPW